MSADIPKRSAAFGGDSAPKTKPAAVAFASTTETNTAKTAILDPIILVMIIKLRNVRYVGVS